MNKVIITGNLTRDPESRVTSSGVSMCTFALAVNRRFVNKQTGQREVDFINVVAWRELGDLCSRYLTKGRKAAVVGSIQTRTYDAQDGTKRNVFEVVADEVEFMSSPQQGSGQGQGRYDDAPPPEPPPSYGDSQGSAPASAPRQSYGAGQTGATGFGRADDDELPF